MTQCDEDGTPYARRFITKGVIILIQVKADTFPRFGKLPLI